MTSETPDGAITQGDPGRSGALKGRLPWGLLDSGLSSLATFITGFLAVHYVATAVLGVYALGLSAFALAGALTSVLAFMAIETAAVQQLTRESRARTVRRSLPQGMSVAGVTALLAGGVTLAVPSSVSFGDRLQLALSCLALSAVSPLQDHVRRMLHNALDSLGAAAVSAVQLVTVLAVVCVVVPSGVEHQPAVSFGALAAANLASLICGLVRINRAPVHAGASDLAIDLRRSMAFGAHLGLSNLIVYTAGLGTIAASITLSSSSSAGEAEAARVLAQPVTVLCVGILSVLTPDLVQAATANDRRRLRALITRFLGFIGAVTLVWSLLAWQPFHGSPLPRISPSAYLVPGLLLLTVPGQVLGYAAAFGATVTQATGRLSGFAILQVEAALVGLIVTVIDAKHGAWALALGSIISGILMLLGSLLLTLGPGGGAATGGRQPAVDAAGPVAAEAETA